MKIKTWRNPYDNGTSLTIPKEIEINPGLTVLVGCNGAGKTTLLSNIKEELKKQNIPYMLFDNLKDGGSNAISELFGAFKESDMSLGMSLWEASEGEAIKINLGRQASQYKSFFETGKVKEKFSFLKNEQEINTNIRVLLYDATDSGLSIDSICEIKDLFETMLEDSKKQNIELYIIISANEYELCRNSDCFDVNKGKYICFKDYEDYRTFILNSATFKAKRLEKEHKYNLERKAKLEKEFNELKEKTDKKIQEIKEKAEKENRKLTYKEERDIYLLEDKLSDFKRKNRPYI